MLWRRWGGSQRSRWRSWPRTWVHSCQWVLPLVVAAEGSLWAAALRRHDGRGSAEGKHHIWDTHSRALVLRPRGRWRSRWRRWWFGLPQRFLGRWRAIWSRVRSRRTRRSWWRPCDTAPALRIELELEMEGSCPPLFQLGEYDDLPFRMQHVWKDDIRETLSCG